MISDPSVWRTLECLKRAGVITDMQMNAALRAEDDVEQEALEHYLATTSPPPKHWWQRRKRLRTP